MTTRRPRSTPEKACEDIAKAIKLLAAKSKREPSQRLTAADLAAAAGMSRKQLYHYFRLQPTLEAAWKSIGSAATRLNDIEDALRDEIRNLKSELEAWQTIAVAARAEVERVTEQNSAISEHNERLRQAVVEAKAANAAQVVAPLNRSRRSSPPDIA